MAQIATKSVLNAIRGVPVTDAVEMDDVFAACTLQERAYVPVIEEDNPVRRSDKTRSEKAKKLALRKRSRRGSRE